MCRFSKATLWSLALLPSLGVPALAAVWGGNTYQFQMCEGGVNPDLTRTNPVPVSLTVGSNTGSGSVVATF